MKRNNPVNYFLVGLGLFFWLTLLHCPLSYASLGTQTTIAKIIRQNNGDSFSTQGVECNEETCVGISSGTAGLNSVQEDTCTCQCHPHLPAFREDLQICVDDIHECVLSPFVSSSISQQIPFVFLPLKGQIIHPSKEISFAGLIETPLCAVSGAKFLTDGGWIDLRNPIDTDVPFRLFRDEGRTFLQWVGEPELRKRMSGRLVLVHLMCREIAAKTTVAPAEPELFTPCVAFRVVGTPMKYATNVSEVVFVANPTQSTENSPSGLSVSEYVAIGICSVLLGLIYVASVFLYLHIRRRRKDSDKSPGERSLPTQGMAEEGVIKNNPLLNMVRHFPGSENTFSDTNSSDTDQQQSQEIVPHDDRKKNILLTSAIVHPQSIFRNKEDVNFSLGNNMHQENIECLPEENVSIVETLEGRTDDKLDSKLIGTARRKLYFNPAYFDPQLLMVPPPAALEFLTKIREVISIAKQKMAAKKFSPRLVGIPEEDPSYLVEVGSDISKSMVSRRGSAVSLKRENSRRKKSCSGCPGCESQEFRSLSGKLPHFADEMAACESCVLSSNSKQQSIRKWLEDVPVVKNDKNIEIPTKIKNSHSRPQTPDQAIRPHLRSVAPCVKSGMDSDSKSQKSQSSCKSKRSSVKSKTRPKCPPPLPPTTKPNVNKLIKKPPAPKKQEGNIYDLVSEPKLPPPDMIQEAIMKNGQRLLINKLDGLKPKRYDTDSLERSKRGFRTPPEYRDFTPVSSNSSPTLNGALPMDEEMTMRNAIINTKTGNMTISKLKISNAPENKDISSSNEDHDYELIILKRGDETGNSKTSIFKLPELLQRKNTGYSLVSEVYVNNGYNYSSQPSTPTGSDCSTLERPPKITYEPNRPGHLLIEVQDCADNYIRQNESDAFEPDTLDRKPKMKLYKRIDPDDYVDSLERPNHILLRSSGSFIKKEPLTQSGINEAFDKNFASLREIYEARAKKVASENRSNRKLRKSVNPPDIIPPESDDGIYEHPKPPRPVLKDLKPPLPPKRISPTPPKHFTNGQTDISILKNFIHNEDFIFKNGINGQIILQNSIDAKKLPSDVNKKIWRRVISVKQDDSGYLSTDSNESHRKSSHKSRPGSETDESLGDGQSESGAESIETHSVFFGSYRKTANSQHQVNSSIDSGVGSDTKKSRRV